MALCVTYCLRSSGCQIILQVCRLNWTCSLNSPCQLLTSLSSLGTMSHVYNKLHKHLEEHQMRELSWLIESEETDLATKATITQCLHSTSHQNSCAMDSPFFFFFLKAHRKKSQLILVHPWEDLAWSRSCLSKGHRVCQLSAVTWLCQHCHHCQCCFQLGWCFAWLCEANNTTYRHTGNVNKNHHYCHEKETFTVLMSATDTVTL